MRGAPGTSFYILPAFSDSSIRHLSHFPHQQVIPLARIAPGSELAQVGARFGQVVALCDVQVLLTAERAEHLRLKAEQAARAGFVARLGGSVKDGQAVAGVDGVRHLRAKQFY